MNRRAVALVVTAVYLLLLCIVIVSKLWKQSAEEDDANAASGMPLGLSSYVDDSSFARGGDENLYFDQRMEASGNGVFLKAPIPLGLPSFDTHEFAGSFIPYAKVECSEEVLMKGHKVPNIVHYVWFGEFRINMVQYYAMRSAALIQKPHMIILHMNRSEPVGPYWKRLKSEVPCIHIVKTDPPTKIFDRKIELVEHQSDVVRINILLKYGGIYADVNVVFVRPMDDLMAYSAVLGKEEDGSYGNSFIISEKNASFIQLWKDSYINFDYSKWSAHSTAMPKRLHKMFPHVPLHVEEYSMMRPNYRDAPEWLTNNNWDLRYNYCVHLYVNVPKAKECIAPILELPEADIITLDNTFGQLIRISLFGTPHFLVDDIDEQLLKIHSPFRCGNQVPTKGDEIPRELHYVWNGEKLLLHHYLSVRSAIQSIRPSTVYFHALSDEDPFYYSYIAMTREISCLQIVDASHLKDPSEDSAETPHLRNLLPKLRVLHEYGGIVLDFNTTVLQSLDELMKSSNLVVGKANGGFDYGILMTKPKSPTIERWIQAVNKSADDYDKALESLLDSPLSSFVTIPSDLISVPGRSWFFSDFPDIPLTKTVSLRKSGLELEEVDFNEKEVLKQKDFLGILARIILLGDSSSTNIKTMPLGDTLRR